MNKLAVITTSDRRVSRKNKWYRMFFKKSADVFCFSDYGLEISFIYLPFTLDKLETSQTGELERFSKRAERFCVRNNINDVVMDEDVWNKSYGRIRIGGVSVHDGSSLKRSFAFDIFSSYRRIFEHNGIVSSVCIVDKTFSGFSEQIIRKICRFVKYIYVDTDDVFFFENFSSRLYGEYGLMLQRMKISRVSEPVNLIIFVDGDVRQVVYRESTIINLGGEQYFENSSGVISDIDLDFSLSMLCENHSSYLKIDKNVFASENGVNFKVKKTHILQSFLKLGIVNDSCISFKSFL